MRTLWILCQRELAAYFATPLAYVFLFVFQVLCGILTFFVGGFYERGQADLAPFFDYHPWLFLFFAPAVAMRLWAEERRLGTQELLITLPVSLGETVIAKFLAAWGFVGLALALTFPLWVTVNWLGDPDNGAIAAAYLGSWLMAGAYLAVGEAISAATTSQTIAFVVTAAVGFILTAAGTPAVLAMFLPWAPAGLIDQVAALSFPAHFYSLARGTVALRDLGFFALTIAAWLLACAYLIDRARSFRRPRLLWAALASLLGAQATAALPNFHLDWTEGQLYTLSPATRQLLAKLNPPVRLEFYFSARAAKDLPAVRAYARRVFDLLKEYAASGRIRLQRIEVEPFSEAEDRAAERGLKGVRLHPEVPEIYFGLVAESSGRRAAIPFFNQERERYLEYDISELIAQVSRDHPPRIALYAEPNLLLRGGINPWNQAPQPPWAAVEALARGASLTWLDKDFQTIPEDTELLVLIHPKALAEASLYAIDQFVLRGRPALIFVDPYAELDGPPRFVAPNVSKSSDLNRLFRAWGFEHRTDRFVADARYATLVTVAAGRPPSRHLGLLSLDREALSDEAILASLDKLVFSSAGALWPLNPGIAFVPLARSSDQAMEMPTVALDYLFDPAILNEAFQAQGRPLTLAARIEGRFASAFAEGPPPGTASGSHLRQSQTLSRLIVVGDSDFLTDRLWVKAQTGPDGERELQALSDNGAFLLSAVDYLTGHPELIAIRGRGQYLRPLTRVEALRRQAETRFQAKLEALRAQLADAEHKLHDRQDPAALQERLRLRAELRQLMYQYNQEVETLGNRLKLIHLALAPLASTLLVWAAAFGLRALARRRL
nr:ABC-2 type transport system permease protein [uncultured Gammaproteobacteria bacterium]